MLLLLGGSPTLEVIGRATLSDAGAGGAVVSDGPVSAAGLSDALVGNASVVDSSP